MFVYNIAHMKALIISNTPSTTQHILYGVFKKSFIWNRLVAILQAVDRQIKVTVRHCFYHIFMLPSSQAYFHNSITIIKKEKLRNVLQCFRAQQSTVFYTSHHTVCHCFYWEWMLIMLLKVNNMAYTSYVGLRNTLMKVSWHFPSKWERFGKLNSTFFPLFVNKATSYILDDAIEEHWPSYVSLVGRNRLTQIFVHK